MSQGGLPVLRGRRIKLGQHQAWAQCTSVLTTSACVAHSCTMFLGMHLTMYAKFANPTMQTNVPGCPQETVVLAGRLEPHDVQPGSGTWPLS